MGLIDVKALIEGAASLLTVPDGAGMWAVMAAAGALAAMVSAAMTLLVFFWSLAAPAVWSGLAGLCGGAFHATGRLGAGMRQARMATRSRLSGARSRGRMQWCRAWAGACLADVLACTLAKAASGAVPAWPWGSVAGTAAAALPVAAVAAVSALGAVAGLHAGVSRRRSC